MEIMLRERAQLVILTNKQERKLELGTRTVKEENSFFVIVLAERLAFPKLSTDSILKIIQKV